MYQKVVVTSQKGVLLLAESQSCIKGAPLAKIIYTRTDEAPLLATYSLKPVVEAFAGTAGIDVETRDISLAGRILAQFPDYLTEEQRVEDALAEHLVINDIAHTDEHLGVLLSSNFWALSPLLNTCQS